MVHGFIVYLNMETTRSWTKLKHIATTAIPASIYAEQAQKESSSAFLPGCKSPNPIVPKLVKQK